MEIGLVGDIDPDDYKKNKPTFAGYYVQILSKYTVYNIHLSVSYI